MTQEINQYRKQSLFAALVQGIFRILSKMSEWDTVILIFLAPDVDKEQSKEGNNE